MRIVVSTLAAMTLSASFTGASFAGPVHTPAATISVNPSILPVQGWWEREHRDDRARNAYSRLPPEAMHRYNRLEREQRQLTRERNELDRRIRRIEEEQHEILGLR